MSSFRINGRKRRCPCVSPWADRYIIGNISRQDCGTLVKLLDIGTDDYTSNTRRGSDPPSSTSWDLSSGRFPAEGCDDRAHLHYPLPFFNCCFHPSTRALFPSASASGTI